MSGADLERAELFDIFSNARRRHTIRYLIREAGTCDLGPLVEHVASWENDVPPEAVTRAQRRRVYISLYQTHLPMLEDHGLIDWDPDTHTIDLRASEKRFEPFLEQTRLSSRRWHLVYGAATVAVIGAIGLAVAPIGPVGAGVVPILVLGLCVVVLGIALLHRFGTVPGSPLR